MRHGPFARLWQAGLVSSTGDWVAVLATLSLADNIAGEGGIVLALVSRILPGLFFAAIGGIVADRLNRKAVMVFTEVGRAGLVVALAFVDTIVMLVVVNLLLEALTLVFQPAKEAAVPRLVDKQDLVRANSLSLSAAYGTFPLGAALFLAVAPLSERVSLGPTANAESLAFIFDSVTFLASALMLMTLPAIPSRLQRQRERRFDLSGPMRDFKEGVLFVAKHPKIRNIVIAMTLGLVGGGMIVVLGKPFARKVLEAGTAGFPALLTAFGFGAAAGIVLVTAYGPRIENKDVSFALSLIVTGVGLSAGSLVQSIFGGVGWIFVMGFGAGSAYVFGFAYLHEQVLDEVRGRTFAALFSLMRIGFLASMAAAPPLALLANDVLPGLLATGSRVVLLIGGGLITLSGVTTLISIRRHILAPDAVEARIKSLEAATEAFRSMRETRPRTKPDDQVTGSEELS